MMATAVMLFACIASAQFKSQVENQQSVSQSLVHPGSGINSFLGLLNPDNFMMRHSFDVSYISSGGYGLSLASYTNSMFYKIADPLNVRFDITLQGSPFGNSAGLQQNDLNKIFLSNAELNYRPADNVFIKLQYNQVPFNRYYYNDRFNPSSFMYGDQ
jgi:hypothetical protein